MLLYILVLLPLVLLDSALVVLEKIKNVRAVCVVLNTVVVTDWVPEESSVEL